MVDARALVRQRGAPPRERIHRGVEPNTEAGTRLALARRSTCRLTSCPLLLCASRPPTITLTPILYLTPALSLTHAVRSTATKRGGQNSVDGRPPGDAPKRPHVGPRFKHISQSRMNLEKQLVQEPLVQPKMVVLLETARHRRGTRLCTKTACRPSRCQPSRPPRRIAHPRCRFPAPPRSTAVAPPCPFPSRHVVGGGAALCRAGGPPRRADGRGAPRRRRCGRARARSRRRAGARARRRAVSACGDDAECDAAVVADGAWGALSGRAGRWVWKLR